MIDLHCHILPGIDDGARDMAVALEMAQTAAEDGIRAIVCTPHITPGIFDNEAGGIRAAIEEFVLHTEEAGIDLAFYMGADIRITPGMGEHLRAGNWPTIAGTRYFLFEPDHNVMQPGMVRLAQQLLGMGFVPVLTHPERLKWVDRHYEVVRQLWRMGCVVQITAGAIVGRFGKHAQHWAERMLRDGLVDVIATDAHNMHRRPPLLREGYEAAAAIVGQEAARAMVVDTPLAILQNKPWQRCKPASPSAERSRELRKSGFSLLDSLRKTLHTS